MLCLWHSPREWHKSMPTSKEYILESEKMEKKKKKEEEMSSTFDWEQSLRFGTSIKETWLNWVKKLDWIWMGGQKQSILVMKTGPTWGKQEWSWECKEKVEEQGRKKKAYVESKEVTYRRRKGTANESYWSLGKEVSPYRDKKWVLSKIKSLFQENYIVQICRLN